MCWLLQVPVWTDARLNWTSLQIGGLLAFGAIVVIATQSAGVLLIIPRYGEYKVLVRLRSDC